MRISDKMTYDNIQKHLNQNREELVNLQTQAATQKRISKPSDDPISSTRVLGSKTEERGIQQFLKNGSIAQSFLDFSDQSLSEVSEGLSRVKELILSQVNDASANPQTRQVVATEIDQLFWQTVQIANRKLGDRFVFGGHQTTQSPFDANGNYRGDRGDIKIQVNKQTFLPINVPGAHVFLGQGLSDDGISRARLETPMTVDELIPYKQETLEQPGMMSPRGVDQDGESEFIGPQRGLASVGKKDQPLKTSLDTKGVNVFSLLRRIHSALMVNDRVALQDSLDELDQANGQIILARAELGSRLMSLESEMGTLTKNKIDSKILTSQLEDADSFKVLSDITKNQSTLEATLKTSGRLVQPSLLDFLR